MLTKIILFAVIAACGAPSAPTPTATDPPAEPPDEIQPDGPTVKDDTYFCCVDVNHKAKSGDGCVTIGEKEIDRCDTVLACAEGFTKKDGTVVCF